MIEQYKFHISLHVSDIEKTTSFYKRLFGQDPIKVKTNYSKFELDNPGLVLSFIESKDPSPNFGHLGIRVNDNEELLERKKEIEKLITIELEEENVACCYAIQNKFWVKDPDGYEWEVYHFLKDDVSIGGCQPVKQTDKKMTSCC